MAKPVFEPEKAVGKALTEMDKQELCVFVSSLCRAIVAEVGSRGRRGGIYPENISVSPEGEIAVGPAGKSPWVGQELNFIAPELYWNGQLSAASDVYSVGLLMYYALNGGKLPLEEEYADAQLRRMNGGNPRAPKNAGRRLGAIIEKSLRFKAAERYQTLEELRAVVDSCVKNLYLSGVPSSEAIFRKNDGDLDDVERMMVGIIERDEDEAIATQEDYPEEEPEDGVKVYKPASKSAQKETITGAQSEMLSQKMKTTGAPAVPKAAPEAPLNPVTPKRSSPAVQYKMKTDRERKIAEEVKKRRRRPLAVILVLCGVLVMVAIIMNAMLKDWDEARTKTSVIQPSTTEDPFPPIPTHQITQEDFGAVLTGPSVTMEPVVVPENVEIPPEHGYQTLKDDCSWTEAQRKAAALGGHLVSIDDEEELNAVIAMAEEAGLSRVWIGCRRVNGEYLWDGKEKTFTGYFKWAGGEPTFVDTNDKVAEDYVMLWNNRGWAYNDNRDDPCHDYPQMYSGTMGYICEFNDD